MIKSTPRIDELFQKGAEDGLTDAEKTELIALLKDIGVCMILAESLMPESDNVH